MKTEEETNLMDAFLELLECEKKEYAAEYPTIVNQLRESFIKEEKTNNDKKFYYALGGAVLAPLYVGFCEWAVEVAKQENIKLIFPLMREGYLYDKILKVIIESKNEDIKVVPVWVSRKSSYAALCYNTFSREFFINQCYGVFGTMEVCFESLGLEEYTEIYEKYGSTGSRFDSDTVNQIYDEIIKQGLEKKINKKIEDTKKILEEYLLQNGATEDFMTLDHGTAGTLPQIIDNSMSDNVRKIHLFLKAGHPVKERVLRGHDIRYLCAEFEENIDKIEVLFSMFSDYLFETVTMGNMEQSTALGYEKQADGQISVKTTLREFNKQTASLVTLIQEGILDFAKDYIKLKEDGKISLRACELVNLGLKSFCRLVDKPFLEEVINLSCLEFDQHYAGKNVRFVADGVNECNLLEFPQGSITIDMTRRQNREESAWLQGSLMLKEYQRKKVYDSVYCRKVAVYGYGYWGKRVIDLLQDYAVEIVCIIDQKMAGGKIGKYPIISIEELCKYRMDDVVVASVDFKKEMTENLQNYARVYNREFAVHDIEVC